MRPTRRHIRKVLLLLLLVAATTLQSASPAAAGATAGWATTTTSIRMSYDVAANLASPPVENHSRSRAVDGHVAVASTHFIASSSGLDAPEATRILRAVEPDELADLVESGRHRTIPGLEGKYFFPTQQQAENFAELMAKTGRGPYCITSGCIDPGLLRQLEPLSIAGEGRAWFIPENLLPYINDIIIHGPAG